MTEQQTATEIKCTHPEAVGKRWGDPISEERRVELQGYLGRWATETDHGAQKGPFDGVKLTGADVCWLAGSAGPNPPTSEHNLDLAGAVLDHAHLEGADLTKTRLDYARLREAHLNHAKLLFASLEHTNLHEVYLQHANLYGAQLEHANLREAHLEHTNLTDASLAYAIFRYAAFDADTNLTGVRLQPAHQREWSSSGGRTTTPVLGDIRWGAVGTVDLTRIWGNWEGVRRLGDEQGVSWRDGAATHANVVRAYRQLANQLRAQGLGEVADRFTYRAQVWQRRLLCKQRKVGGCLFLLLLAALSGYGYKLSRIFVAYAIVVLLFAAGYFFAGGLPAQTSPTIQQQALDSLQVSLNAIHGRVFFTSLGLDTLQSWLATIESIVGIVIEGVFVAMLIQRFFTR